MRFAVTHFYVRDECLFHSPKCLGTLRDKITKYDAIIYHNNIE